MVTASNLVLSRDGVSQRRHREHQRAKPPTQLPDLQKISQAKGPRHGAGTDVIALAIYPAY